MAVLIGSLATRQVKDSTWHSFRCNTFKKFTTTRYTSSKAIHGIVAARCGDSAQGYRFWREGSLIDLGDDPHSCDDGIHAAATGAIWLGAIQGFAGVNVRHGELHLAPALPEHWQTLSFPLRWQGIDLQVTINATEIRINLSLIHI